jgi:hypothetical protein
MRLTILYRHPQRPDEAGMVVVTDQAEAEEEQIRLESRGFRVVEVSRRLSPLAPSSIAH